MCKLKYDNVNTNLPGWIGGHVLQAHGYNRKNKRKNYQKTVKGIVPCPEEHFRPEKEVNHINSFSNFTKIIYQILVKPQSSLMSVV